VTRAWAGVEWMPEGTYVGKRGRRFCRRHDEQLGRFTHLCHLCHVEQIESASKGSFEMEYRR
jgi:hypothetical protein